MKRLCLLLLAATLGLAAPAGADPGLPPSPLGSTPFMWGVTLSGLQNDGISPSSDWNAMLRGHYVPDTITKGPDFRGHLDADLDRARSLGLNAFRTSIEWDRLEPRPGYYDPHEIAYVHRLLEGIRDRGMTPVITLFHFTAPEWTLVPDRDGLIGWESPRTVAAFDRFTRFVVREFGAEIPYYITFNEPSTSLLGGYAAGMIPPRLKGPDHLARALANIVQAHKDAYGIIHALQPAAKVSMSEYNCVLPVGGLSYRPGEALFYLFGQKQGWDGQPRAKYLDYVALHYYGTNDAFTEFPIEPYKWAANPADFKRTLESYYRLFHLPIMVAENGCATDNGAPRPDGWSRRAYMVQHIRALEAVKAEGVPILGYFYWTLTDNYEWGSYNPRFGLWRVDIRSGDLTRHETPLVAVYRDIIRHNGVTPDLLAKYPNPDAPQLAKPADHLASR
ncbi:MAG TPA: family 1 glycosylhydrolase [Oscillatoriaceae cyanobacterium]